LTDILDSLEELDAELDFDDADFESEVEHITGVLVDETDVMNVEEATEITNAIRSTAMATYVLLSEAHRRDAHRALGYSTWADYVREEFDMSAQRSYQLLDLSRAVEMLESAVPDGVEIRLTEAQARDIKRELPRITEQIEESTKDLSPEDAQDVVDGLIDEMREQKKLEKKAEQEKAEADADAEDEEYQKGLEAAADALLDADRPEGMTDIADDGLIEMDIDGDDALSPEDTMSLYNFFNVLTSVSTLPTPDEFIEIVPQSRVEEINDQLIEVTGWLNRFQTLWELREG
jgi:hypothetical protein